MSRRRMPGKGGDAGAARFADLLCPIRCGACLRGGGICERPPVPGRRRCIAHGGAARNGAPAGNRNRLEHGARTRAAMAERRALNAMLRAGWRTLREIGKG